MSAQKSQAAPIQSGSLPAGFRYAGTIYALGHLRAYETTYERPEEDHKPAVIFKVAVSFSHHCFTEGIDDGDEFSDDQVFTHNGKARLFNVRRWNLSKHLPAIVAGLALRDCNHAINNNFVTVAVVDEGGNEVEYDVYFRVRKTGKGRLWLNIESAYVRDSERKAGRPKGRRVAFLLVLHNILNGKPVRP